MRARRRLPVEDEADVPMTPLIDCVFLLLIFFLVTTMIKRKEAHLPNTLPDPTAAVSQQRRQEVLVIALDAQGRHWRDDGSRSGEGAIAYAPVPDLALHLREVVAAGGREILQRPVRIDLDREVEFQDALRTLDIVKLQGFAKVGLKTRVRQDGR